MFRRRLQLHLFQELRGVRRCFARCGAARRRRGGLITSETRRAETARHVAPHWPKLHKAENGARLEAARPTRAAAAQPRRRATG